MLVAYLNYENRWTVAYTNGEYECFLYDDVYYIVSKYEKSPEKGIKLDKAHIKAVR